MHRLCKETVLILLGMLTLGVIAIGLDFYVLAGVAQILVVPFWTGTALVISVGAYNVLTIRYLYLYLLSGHFSRIQGAINYGLAVK